MSERSDIAQKIADWVNEKKLNAPFGGDVIKNNRYYGILFAYPRKLDGLVQVYGPKFILVQAQGPWVHSTAQEVFDSVDNAIKFMQAAFVDHDWDAASQVPRRERADVKSVRKVGR